MDNEKLLTGILKRLDILISLELEKPLLEKATAMSERIERLDSLGLPPSEIGEVIGKRTNYVSAALSQRRVASSRKRSGKK